MPAPVREQLAAACVLAADWQGEGPIFDPMFTLALNLLYPGSGYH